ncbi:MAG: hypothetical protein ABI414_15680, partial [Devosia sp.]
RFWRRIGAIVSTDLGSVAAPFPSMCTIGMEAWIDVIQRSALRAKPLQLAQSGRSAFIRILEGIQSAGCKQVRGKKPFIASDVAHGEPRAGVDRFDEEV